MLCRECDKQIASAVEKRIAADDERADPVLSDGRKDGAEIRFRAGAQDTDLLPDSARCCPDFSRFDLGIRSVTHLSSPLERPDGRERWRDLCERTISCPWCTRKGHNS